MKELIILETEVDEFIVVSGERIETQTDPNFYPFTHALTFRLCPRDAARIGEDIITIPEAAILQDCQLPKATELPAVETAVTNVTKQLTLFDDTETQQLTLF